MRKHSAVSRVRKPGPALAFLAAAAVALHAASASAQVERWSLVPELRIGSVDDPRTSLTRVTDLAVANDGRIYAVQPQDRSIRIFDSGGDPVGVIGRGGEGPGEFSDLIGSIGFLGDTLWVSDSRLQRVSFFDDAGSFLGSLPLTSAALRGNFTPAVPMRLLSDGTALVFPGYRASAASSGEISRRPLLRIGRRGEIVDTVLWLPAGGDQISISKGDGRLYTSQPFSDAPLSAISRNGETVAMVERRAAPDRAPAHFHVTSLTPGGDTIFSKRYRYTPAPMPRALVDSVVTAKAEGMARSPLFGSIREAESALRDVLYLPSMSIPITGVVVASDGSIWLRREERPGEAHIWNVLDARGEIRASFTLSSGVSIRTIEGTAVWAVELDEMDVPFIVRYGVRPAQP